MQTVGEAIKSLLPKGTDAKGLGGPRSYSHAPLWPGDVFGVTAYLLDRSGAYQRVIAASGAYRTPKADLDFPRIVIKRADRAKATRLAVSWCRSDVPKRAQVPKEIDELWGDLTRGWQDPLIAPIPSKRGKPPSWWHPAMMLMMISDNASEGLGYPPSITNPKSKKNPKPKSKANWVQRRAAKALIENYETYPDAPEDWMDGWVHNWSALLDGSICCVVPKSSAPEVGCTLRALSHNLALAPSAGEARANWWVPDKPPSVDSEALNLLLMPFPYWIPSRSFKGKKNRHGSHVFDIEQTWLPDAPESIGEFRNFLETLLRRAKRQVGDVHGLVFPELSLNQPYFEAVSEFAKQEGIRLLISGVSKSEIGDGNQVVAEVNWLEGSRPTLTTIRQKHHRWKIERNQIKSYGLGDTLNPRHDWWEKLRVAHRSIDVFTLSEKSTCTTLVCEDLARIDPCQRLIRAIGPSLVIALLMDGPQLVNRWPARYATVLAEDPGASVLTFTSLGLIARSEHQGWKSNRVIGLWKERSGDEVEIKLRDSSHAVLLTLRGNDRKTKTMDGRIGPDRTEWSLVGQIQLSGGTDIPDWILDGQQFEDRRTDDEIEESDANGPIEEA